MTIAIGVAAAGASAVGSTAPSLLHALSPQTAPPPGTLGALGVGTALVGTVNWAGNYWFEGFVYPWFTVVAPVALNAEPAASPPVGGISGWVLFALGWILFSVASLRARVFPAAILVALVAGAAAGFLALTPPFGVPLGLVLAWPGG